MLDINETLFIPPNTIPHMAESDCVKSLKTAEQKENTNTEYNYTILAGDLSDYVWLDFIWKKS